MTVLTAYDLASSGCIVTAPGMSFQHAPLTDPGHPQSVFDGIVCSIEIFSASAYAVSHSQSPTTPAAACPRPCFRMTLVFVSESISQGINTSVNVCYELDVPPHFTYSPGSSRTSKSTVSRGRTPPGAGPGANETLPLTAYAAANPGTFPAPFCSSFRGYIPTTPCDVTGLNGYPSHSQYIAGPAYNFSTSYPTYDNNSFDAMPGTVNPIYMHIGDRVDQFEHPAYGPSPPT
jgi:hypothetical protein